MAITVSTIKIKSLSERVKALSDAQIQSALDTATALLEGVGLNPLAMNYTTIFDKATVALFDWYIANPEFSKGLSQGGLRESFLLTIPPAVYSILRPILADGFGIITREA